MVDVYEFDGRFDPLGKAAATYEVIRALVLQCIPSAAASQDETLPY